MPVPMQAVGGEGEDKQHIPLPSGTLSDQGQARWGQKELVEELWLVGWG